MAPLVYEPKCGGRGVAGSQPQGAETLPLLVAKTGRNHLNEEFTPLLPTGIGERF
jgi:hypothetical protein